MHGPLISKQPKDVITDLDNNRFIDFSTMGVGTNVLGYANSQVDKAVKNTILKGNLSTLNCKEEVLLAEKLIEIDPGLKW